MVASRCDAPCAWRDVGVVAGTWTLFFPPTHPRGVLGNQGDTPWNPRQRGQAPSAKGGQVCTPPGLRKAILLMAIRLKHEGADSLPTHRRFLDTPSRRALQSRLPVHVMKVGI